MYRLKFDSEKPYLFISYSSKNKEIIENNVEYLQKKYSLNIWYDEELTAGSDWDREALPKLRDPNCKIVVFFASEEALMSKNVKMELDAAKRFHKIIIPINFSEMSFDDVLNTELVRKYNRTTPDGVTNADHLIQEHLNEKKTYIFLHQINYYSELIKAILIQSKNTIEIIETDYVPDPEKKVDDGSAGTAQRKDDDAAGQKAAEPKAATSKAVEAKAAEPKTVISEKAERRIDGKTSKDKQVPGKTEPKKAAPTTETVNQKAGEINSGIIRYKLSGKEYKTNQSEFMYSVYEAVVPKHTDKLVQLDKELTSFSLTDYSVVERAERPSYFRGCYTFLAGGRKVCVGSSYGVGEKLRQIEKLLKICGEDERILEVLTDSEQDNKAQSSNKSSDSNKSQDNAKAQSSNKAPDNPVKQEKGSRERGDVNFIFLGKEYTGYVYSDLLAKIIEELFVKYPNKVAKALKGLDSFIAASRPEPYSCFRGVKTIQVNGKTYYVGTNTATPTKLKQIESLLNVMDVDTGRDILTINRKSLEETRNLLK